MKLIEDLSGNGRESDGSLCRTGLVTVVIPSYRHERFIAEAVASVAAQEYRNLEVVLVDDESPDRTFEAGVDALRRSGIPFRALRKRRQGSCAPALNAGIGLARGEFLCILASDDRFMPSKLGESVRALSSSGADVALGNTGVMDENGRSVSESTTDPKRVVELHEKGRLFRALLRSRPEAALPYLGLMFRRDAFDVLGLFDPQIFTEDYEMALRIASSPVRMVAVDDVVGLHRASEGGAGRSPRVAEGVERCARKYGGWSLAGYGLLARARASKAEFQIRDGNPVGLISLSWWCVLYPPLLLGLTRRLLRLAYRRLRRPTVDRKEGRIERDLPEEM